MTDSFQPGTSAVDYEQQLDALSSLLLERRNAVISASHSEMDVAQLDERIRQLVDGLLAVSQDLLPLLEDTLASKDAAHVYAAAYVLLRMSHEAAIDRIVSALMEVTDATRLHAIAQALCDSPIEKVPLELLLDAVSQEKAAAILCALTAGGRQVDRPLQIEELLASNSPWIRTTAWQVVALMGPEHAV